MMNLTKFFGVASILIFSSTSYALVCQTQMVGPRGAVLEVFEGSASTELEACREARMQCSLRIRNMQRTSGGVVVTPPRTSRQRPVRPSIGRRVARPVNECKLVGLVSPRRPVPERGHHPAPGRYNRWDRELSQLESMIQSGPEQSKLQAVRELERYPVARALLIAVEAVGASSYNVRVTASTIVSRLLSAIDLVSEGVEVAELISPLLSGPNAEVQRIALQILSRLDLPHLLVDVVLARGANSYNVRVQAETTLSSLLSKGLAQQLRRPMLREIENLVLRGSSAEVKISAIKVLVAAGNPSVRMTLIQASSDSSYNVRVAAQDALNRL